MRFQRFHSLKTFPAGFMAVLLCLPAASALISGCNQTPDLPEEPFIFEYGTMPSIQPGDLGLSENSTLHPALDALPLEEGKAYPACGSYSVEVFDADRCVGTLTIHIQDTTPPEFSGQSFEIERQAGPAPDFSSLFAASDLSDVSWTCSLEDAAWNQEGVYEGSISAEDAWGNRTSQSFKLHVLPALNTETGAQEPADPAEQAQNPEPAAQNSESAVNFVKDGILIVNKKHPITKDYASAEDPEAYQAVQALIARAQSEGLDIGNSVSGFRSEQYQADLYNRYVSMHGQQAADRFSARPGYSEHQSGLAFDLTHTDGSLVEKPAEAGWIQANCAQFGLILRYPEGKEEITGYMAEPWHLRYIGEQAVEIMASSLTLEEYLNIEGGDYIN